MIEFTIKTFLHLLRYGEYSCGWGTWNDKPMFCSEFFYYDGYHYSFCFYKIWVSIDE